MEPNFIRTKRELRDNTRGYKAAVDDKSPKNINLLTYKALNVLLGLGFGRTNFIVPLARIKLSFY